jgi:hypothetical protein
MTSKLWNDGSLVRTHLPAKPPNLVVYRSEHGDDLLIAYDEARDTDDKIVRRAYWLSENRDCIQAKRKPHFVPVAEGNELAVVPLDADGKNDADAPPLLRVSYSANGRVLTVISNNKLIEECELPVYADSSDLPQKVLFTPVTVTADATIIGGAAAYVVLNWMAAHP